MTLALVVNSGASPNSAAAAKAQGERYNVLAKNAQVYQRALKAAKKAGAQVVYEMPQINAFTVTSAKAKFESRMAKLKGARVGKDQVRQLVRPAIMKDLFGREPFDPNSGAGQNRIEIAVDSINPDPAFDLPGLMWFLPRTGADQAWDLTTGDHQVTVAVMDTGVDYTHTEMYGNFDKSKLIYFHDTYCLDTTGFDDQDISNLLFGGQAPVDGDFYGHGSWIAGAIAANLDGRGINGIAPDVGITSYKISDWCGGAYSSTLNYAFVVAADHGIDIVNISFGGYDNPNDPASWLDHVIGDNATKYARKKGTLIVGAAGNERTRIMEDGRVDRHGILAVPGDPSSFEDLYGWYESPGGYPAVVDVSATNNYAADVSESCPGDSEAPAVYPTAAWCKPASDAHHPFAPDVENQLAYFSNWGPAIDFAAPGAARKFNVPNADRGGTPGWPYTGIGALVPGSESEGYIGWEDFGMTSNFALAYNCFTFTGGGFPENQCYDQSQGTSMAAPMVVGAAALVASRNLDARGHPDRIVALLSKGATKGLRNYQPELNPDDFSPGDLTGLPCTTGWCHLGGPIIPSKEVYGNGLINAWGALTSSR